jgi:hypothetical protein
MVFHKGYDAHRIAAVQTSLRGAKRSGNLILSNAMHNEITTALQAS